jgi:KR domain.
MIVVEPAGLVSILPVGCQRKEPRTLSWFLEVALRLKYAEQTIQDLIRQGINVEVCRCNVADKQSVEQNLVPLLARMPPVRGVVYGAMVLRVRFSTPKSKSHLR